MANYNSQYNTQYGGAQGGTQGGTYDQYGSQQQGYGGQQQQGAQQQGYGGPQQQGAQQGGGFGGPQQGGQQGWGQQQGGPQQGAPQQGGPQQGGAPARSGASNTDFFKAFNDAKRIQTLGLQHEVSEFVVAGPQGSGKSALIDNFAGIKIARGTIRRPVRYELVRNPQIANYEITVNVSDSDLKKAKAVAKSDKGSKDSKGVKVTALELREVINALGEGAEPICVSVEGANVPNITLMDTPGLKPYGAPDMNVANSIAKNQMLRPNTMILFVIAGNSDPANVPGIDLVCASDPNLDRTVFVTSKVRSALNQYSAETIRMYLSGMRYAQALQGRPFKYHFSVESISDDGDSSNDFVNKQRQSDQQLQQELGPAFNEFGNTIGYTNLIAFSEKLYGQEARKMMIPVKDKVKRKLEDVKSEMKDIERESKIAGKEKPEGSTRYGVVNFLEYYFYQQHVVLEGDHSQSGRPEKYGHNLFEELGKDFTGYEVPIRIPIERVTNYRAKLLGMSQMNRMFEELRVGIMSLFLPIITDSDLLSYAGDARRDSIGFGEIIQKILNNQFATATLPVVRLVRKRITYMFNHFNTIIFHLIEEKVQGQEEEDAYNDFKDAPITCSYSAVKEEFQVIFDEVLKKAVRETIEDVKKDAKKSYQSLGKDIKLLEIPSKEVLSYAIDVIVQTQKQFQRLLDEWCKAVVREISNNYKHKMTFFLKLKVMQHFHSKDDDETEQHFAEGSDGASRGANLKDEVEQLQKLLPRLEQASNANVGN